jgi:hypothetical protein
VSKKRQSVKDNNGELPQKRKFTKTGLTMTSRVCKRAVGRILLFVKDRLVRLISDVHRDLDYREIQEAMDDPESQQVVQQYIATAGIKLRHKNSNEEVFTRQMSLIGEKGQAAADDDDDELHEDLDPEDAQLDVDDEATAAITKTVGDVVRRNSIK